MAKLSPSSLKSSTTGGAIKYNHHALSIGPKLWKHIVLTGSLQ